MVGDMFTPLLAKTCSILAISLSVVGVGVAQRVAPDYFAQGMAKPRVALHGGSHLAADVAPPCARATVQITLERPINPLASGTDTLTATTRLLDGADCRASGVNLVSLRYHIETTTGQSGIWRQLGATVDVSTAMRSHGSALRDISGAPGQCTARAVLQMRWVADSSPTTVTSNAIPTTVCS